MHYERPSSLLPEHTSTKRRTEQAGLPASSQGQGAPGGTRAALIGQKGGRVASRNLGVVMLTTEAGVQTVS